MPSRSGNEPARPPARLTWDEAELIWQARDVHVVKNFFVGLFALILGMEWLVATIALGLVWSTLMVGLQGAVLWGLFRLVYWMAREVWWALARVWKGR